MIYLDTHVAAELTQGETRRFSRRALSAIERDDDVRISPMVLLELDFLYEIQRTKLSAEDALKILAKSFGLRVCDRPFAEIVHQAAEEGWTRDPFDRIIVAQARLGKAMLITRDTTIQAHYSRARA